jgi:two-component system, chemotaxis family, protein-glutamate methylesterase/glutaminase
VSFPPDRNPDALGVPTVGAVPSSSSPRLVVIAASAGALPAIIEVLAPLPSNFPAAIALVQHRSPEDPERLIAILANATRLKVRHAEDDVSLEAGTVYVCPPRVHMITEHRLRLISGPKLRFVQPNADLMFESVGQTYGDRALGIVLSGCGSDAALGSLAMAQAGCTILAQDAQSCGFAGMPEMASKVGAVEQVLTPAEIAHALQRWSEGLPVPCRRELPRADGAENPTTVLLVDDHRIVLDGLRVLLEGESDMRVLGHVEDGASAIEAATELLPDVIVMDIRLPGLDGVAATQQILARVPTIKVVALSSDSHAYSVGGILRAGATGYLTKHRAYGELIQAIRAVRRGETYLSRDVALLVMSGATGAVPLRGRDS